MYDDPDFWPTTTVGTSGFALTIDTIDDAIRVGGPDGLFILHPGQMVAGLRQWAREGGATLRRSKAVRRINGGHDYMGTYVTAGRTVGVVSRVPRRVYFDEPFRPARPARRLADPDVVAWVAGGASLPGASPFVVTPPRGQPDGSAQSQAHPGSRDDQREGEPEGRCRRP